MAANNFFLPGNKNVCSQRDFLKQESHSSWNSINYFPDILKSFEISPLVFNEKKFISVSFKNTKFKNVKFNNCQFINCLFIGVVIDSCEFVDCKFINTNTYKIKIRNSLIDPKQFLKNFELKKDSNIAVDLFQELYKNSKSEEQPAYSRESLYRMNVALGYNLNYKYTNKKLSCCEFIYKKTSNIISRFTTGYGLKIKRILVSLLTSIGFFSFLNFHFKDNFLKGDEPGIATFIDAIYFTCVTITTLGYGDITPTSITTKVIVIFESLIGFLFLSLFVSAFVNKILRT